METKRYQNISTVTTNVMKTNARGESKSMTIKPAQIIHLTDEDVEATKDAFNPRDNNPFDQGWVKEVPKGEGAHPELSQLGKNPTMSSAAKTFHLGKAQTEEMIGKICDHRGLVICRRALDKEREGMGDSQVKAIEEMLDRRAIAVDSLQRENQHKYAMNEG